MDFNSRNELLNTLGKLNSTVPQRGNRRTSDHTEMYVICRFLKTIATTQSFEYPVSIIGSEKPDFIFRESKQETGIECTEAIPENLAKAQDLLNKYFPEGFLEPSCFKWGSPTMSRKEILEILARSQEKLSGPGWVGDGVEIEWAEGMHGCIVAKTEKLNNSDFSVFEKNTLLIYDNLPQAANDLDKSIQLLLARLQSIGNERNFNFDRVLIDTKGKLISICVPTFTMVDIVD